MIWQIPISAADFQTRLVSWQGNGTCLTPGAAPKVFHLAAGSHELVIRGREPNTRLDRIALLSVPQVTTLPATNITLNSAVLNGLVNPAGIDATVYFQYGPTTTYGSSTPQVSAGHGDSSLPVVANLSGLGPGATCHFRLVGFNTNGADYGADQVFVIAPLPVF